MNEQVPIQPPSLPPDAKPKKKWRWFKITAGLILGIVVLLKLIGSYNPVELELSRANLFDADRDGKALEVLNVGKAPIKITNITINERADCTLSRLSFVDGSKLLPADLKVGDKIALMSSCRIIRASVETDQGPNTYSFTGE
jgi:hypothetical protein